MLRMMGSLQHAVVRFGAGVSAIDFVYLWKAAQKGVETVKELKELDAELALLGRTSSPTCLESTVSIDPIRYERQYAY